MASFFSSGFSLTTYLTSQGCKSFKSSNRFVLLLQRSSNILPSTLIILDVSLAWFYTIDQASAIEYLLFLNPFSQLCRLGNHTRVISAAALYTNVFTLAFLIHIPTNTPGTTYPSPTLVKTISEPSYIYLSSSVGGWFICFYGHKIPSTAFIF